MKITLSKNADCSPQKTKLQQRFDKLWGEVKKKQQAITRLEGELSELHGIYQQKILPVERLAEIPYTQLAQRLIELFTRKSLAKWERQELSIWILECISYITVFNQQASNQLSAAYKQVLADYLQVGIEDIDDQVDSEDEFFENMEDALRGEFDSRENPDYEPQDDLFGFTEDNGFFSAHEKESNEQDVLSDQWLTKIFRRTANVLHPDKERQAAKKLEKENLMTQLLTARKEKDVFRLLNFYMQYVDASDLLMTDEIMENLCQQLSEQKYQLVDEKNRIFYDDPVGAVLHEQLYSRTKKTREINIERYIQGVEESTACLGRMAGSLRNLKELKLHLSNRYDERRCMGFDGFSFE